MVVKYTIMAREIQNSNFLVSRIPLFRTDHDKCIDTSQIEDFFNIIELSDNDVDDDYEDLKSIAIVNDFNQLNDSCDYVAVTLGD